MMTVLRGGEIYTPTPSGRSDVLCVGERIGFVGDVDLKALQNLKVEFEELDCSGAVVTPGFIDCHAHIIGGSAEKCGLAYATPELFFTEFICAGTTTVVGTLGVDTSTKTMHALVAKAKSLRQDGISAYCYTGGYDIPAASLFEKVREDIMFVDEVIGIGEVAISDCRAIEPDIYALARAATDAYVCGLLTGKAGVLHLHTGPGRERLKPVRRLLDEFEIKPETIYATHIERDAGLVDEGIEISKKGCFVDFDVQEKDLYKWYSYYRERGGVLDNLSASSDSGMGSPSGLYEQIQECVVKHKLPLEEILPLVTTTPARALRFDKKGQIKKDFEADFVVMDKNTLEIRHVVARGKVLLKNGRPVKKESFLEHCQRKVNFDAWNENEKA